MKSFKRILCSILTLLLVISFVPNTAFAYSTAESSNTFMSFDKTELKAGETLTVTVYVTETISGVTGAYSVITYDKTLMSVEAVQDGEIFPLASYITSANYPAFKTTVDEAQTINPGVLWTVTFRALEDIADVSSCFFHFATGSYYVIDGTTTKDTFYPNKKADAHYITIYPSGAVSTETGYTVSMGSDQTVTAGETVRIPVTIGSTIDTVTSYNAYDMTFSYDASALTLNMSGSNTEGYRVTLGDGTVRVQRYGEAVELGEALYLEFTANTTASSTVTVTSARVDLDANSVDFDAPAATLVDDTTVVDAANYLVTLPDGFTTDEEDMLVSAGDSFTFKPVTTGYTYEFSVTVGDTTTEGLTFGEDGTYTIEDIHGNVVVKITSKTPKTYSVTVSGDAADYVTLSGDTATYLEDYTFTVTPQRGYTITASLYVDGTYVRGLSSTGTNEDGTLAYTVSGGDITGDIEIRTYMKEAALYKMDLPGLFVDVEPSEITYYAGETVTFKVTPQEGYAIEAIYAYYTPSTTNKYLNVIDNGDGTYTIEDMPAYDVTLGVAVKYTWTAEVSTYLELDDATVFLVTVSSDRSDYTGAFAYDGNVMYKTAQYGEGVYSWLVIVGAGEEALTVETAKALITTTSATAVDVGQDGDVNLSEKVDVNDAQLTYDMYNGVYSDFETVSIQKFLNADVNGDKVLNSTDAVAIVNVMGSN